MQTTAAKPHFTDILPSEWQDLVISAGLTKFRAQQIREGLFQRHAVTPQAMTNLDAKTKAWLDEAFAWDLPRLHQRLDAADGSSKLLLQTGAGQYIETVILRYENRTSLCVSSQVGCRLACSFCQTGKLGFMRNLSSAEIMGQYLTAQAIVAPEGRRISHIVFMGMGEPLDNYDHCLKAVNTLIGEEAYGLGNRHVTVSTSGIAPKILRLAQDSKAALALSLHSAHEETRTRLMPINRRYPLPVLKDALREYQKLTRRKITIEFILIKDETCTLPQAKHLVNFLQGLSAKVNLIPFNEHPGMGYRRPDENEIKAFQNYLAQRSIPAPVRYSKGLEVSGACGQLAAKTRGELDSVPKRSNLMTAVGQEKNHAVPV